MSTLHPVTQHYLSIDAHSPESLKSVDRPLHADYWERFIRSMELLKEIPQRTVYRLTLVKDKNMDEIAAYARLVTIGMPTMIEVKGVTFSGGANEISVPIMLVYAICRSIILSVRVFLLCFRY